MQAIVAEHEQEYCDDETGDPELAESLSIALSSGNLRAQELASSLQKKANAELVEVEDDEDDLVFMAKDDGYSGGDASWDQALPPPAEPMAGHLKGTVKVQVLGGVRQTIDKLNKHAKGVAKPTVIGAFKRLPAGRGRARSTSPQRGLGFPQVGQTELEP